MTADDEEEFQREQSAEGYVLSLLDNITNRLDRQLDNRHLGDWWRRDTEMIRSLVGQVRSRIEEGL